MTRMLMPDQRVPEARGWERRLALLALPLLMRTRSCRPTGRSRRLERTADAKLSAGATAVGAHDRDHPNLSAPRKVLDSAYAQACLVRETK